MPKKGKSKKHNGQSKIQSAHASKSQQGEVRETTTQRALKSTHQKNKRSKRTEILTFFNKKNPSFHLGFYISSIVLLIYRS